MTNTLQPIISVVLPAYNAGPYIEKSIISILDQSFKEFEFIIINDGSTDDTYKIVKEFESKDSRIVFISRESQGLVNSLNEGIKVAKGKWIARMDADDIAYPERFEKQLLQLEKTKADICGTWTKLFGHQGGAFVKHPVSDEAIKTELLFGSAFAHPTVVISKKLLQSLQYRQEWEHCEDYDLWVRAAIAGWKMTNVPEVLLKYRVHEKQISVAKKINQLALTREVRSSYLKYFAKKNEFYSDGLFELLRLREEDSPKVDLNLIERSICDLFKKTSAESGAVLLDHTTRLLFRASVQSTDVAHTWKRIQLECNKNYNKVTYMKLWLLSKLKISANNNLYALLKRINQLFGQD